jgi:hypothetical protein
MFLLLRRTVFSAQGGGGLTQDGVTDVLHETFAAFNPTQHALIKFTVAERSIARSSCVACTCEAASAALQPTTDNSCEAHSPTSDAPTLTQPYSCQQHQP